MTTSTKTPDGIRTAFVADDDKSLLDALTDTLEEMGFHVVVTDSGDKLCEAIHRRAEAGLRPDVVVSDVSMPPGPDGLAVASEVLDCMPGLPIVLLGNVRSSAERDRAHELGVDAVVPKPVALDEFRRVVLEVSTPG